MVQTNRCYRFAGHLDISSQSAGACRGTGDGRGSAAIGRSLLVLLENILGDQRRRHRHGPAAIEGKVRYQLADLLGCHAVVERALEMALELLGAVECDEG